VTDEGRDRDDGDPVRQAPAELPIDGVLDLHQFRPEEAADLVGDYLDACLARNVLAVRIIHGKGIGNLRRIVHAALRRHPAVADFGLATDGSGWGATLVRLTAPGAEGTEHGPQEPPREG
jgi:dsDNA-specific endonuclease/ATPase MutS2